MHVLPGSDETDNRDWAGTYMLGGNPGGIADHEVTPQAPLTGSGCREHCHGGFGGGHPHFLPHAP
jgi:hypothetical protein